MAAAKGSTAAGSKSSEPKTDDETLELLAGIDAPVSSWMDVEGGTDELGKLQVMSLGRRDRHGAVLRYVVDGSVIMCNVQDSVFVDAGTVAGTARLRIQG